MQDTSEENKRFNDSTDILKKVSFREKIEKDVNTIIEMLEKYKKMMLLQK